LNVFDIFLTTAIAIGHDCRSKLQLGLNRGEIEALPPQALESLALLPGCHRSAT
jgi:hypothetical protein